MGIQEFSLSAPSIPVVKQALRNNSIEACRRLAKTALACRSSADMSRCLATARKKLLT
jgi:phosphoenolpyruvate-protein kinase (PTS system EI component)